MTHPFSLISPPSPLDPILETTKEGAAPSFDSPRCGTRIETFMPHREYGFSHSNNGGEF